MTAAELKSTFKESIRKGKLDEGFILLDKHLSKTSDISDDILVMQGRYENNRRMADLGVNNMIGAETNAISVGIVSIINRIKDEDMAEPILDMNSSRLLIICQNDADEFYIRAFCSRMSIPNYDVKQLKEYEEPTDYDFIVFDNHSIKNIEENYRGLNEGEIKHLQLMEVYIKQYNDHKKYMIHFGENTNVVSANRDVIYAGNSKFALFSRIQEMIQYIGKDRLYKRDPSV
jgi:hypothetical protein